MTVATYIIGLDLGKKNDYTALTVLRQRAVPIGRVAPYGYAAAQYHYDLIHAERWRGRPYHEVPGLVSRLQPVLMQRAYEEALNDPDLTAGFMPELQVITPLVVDATGVGVAVVDSIKEAGIKCISLTIHGGDAVIRKDGDVRVPKRELVGVLQVLFQSGRLAISSRLPLASVITAELENFQAKIKLNGHDTYGAGEDWRAGNHDDLVLSMAMAAWYGEKEDPVAKIAASEAVMTYFEDQYITVR